MAKIWAVLKVTEIKSIEVFSWELIITNGHTTYLFEGYWSHYIPIWGLLLKGIEVIDLLRANHHGYVTNGHTTCIPIWSVLLRANHHGYQWPHYQRVTESIEVFSWELITMVTNTTYLFEGYWVHRLEVFSWELQFLHHIGKLGAQVGSDEDPSLSPQRPGTSCPLPSPPAESNGGDGSPFCPVHLYTHVPQVTLGEGFELWALESRGRNRDVNFFSILLLVNK